MPIYTVHVPRAAADAADATDRTVFVRDGFNGWAFVFGPLFLLRHRAWIAAAAWFVLVIGGAWLAAWVGLPGLARFALLLLVQLFLGLEGNMLRRLALARRGFDIAEVVAGSGRESGEMAFFRGQAAPPAAVAFAPPVRTLRRGVEPDGVIGLFPSSQG